MEGGGLKRSSSPSGPSFVVPNGLAPIAATLEGTSGCSRAYNTCTSSCKVLQYTCRLSRDALSSATRVELSLRSPKRTNASWRPNQWSYPVLRSHSASGWLRLTIQLYGDCPAPVPYSCDVTLSEVVPPWLIGLQLGHYCHYYFLRAWKLVDVVAHQNVQ
jgi:hypothetical protein